MSEIEPACWSWPLPQPFTKEQELDRVMSEQASLPTDQQMSRGAHAMVMQLGDVGMLGVPDSQAGEP